MEAIDAFSLSEEALRQLEAFYQNRFSPDGDSLLSQTLRVTDTEAAPNTRRISWYVRCPNSPILNLGARKVYVGGVVLNEKVDDSAPYQNIWYPFGTRKAESLEVYGQVLQTLERAGRAGKRFSLLTLVETEGLVEETSRLARLWNRLTGGDNTIKVASQVPFLVVRGVNEIGQEAIKSWQKEQADCSKVETAGDERTLFPMSTRRYLRLTGSDYPGA